MGPALVDVAPLEARVAEIDKKIGALGEFAASLESRKTTPLSLPSLDCYTVAEDAANFRLKMKRGDKLCLHYGQVAAELELVSKEHNVATFFVPGQGQAYCYRHFKMQFRHAEHAYICDRDV